MDVRRIEIEKGESLTKWMSLLAHFNGGKPLQKELVRDIEEYFEHYWSHDKRQAVKSVVTQLPESVTRKLYIEVLFRDFLYEFRVYFRMASPLLGMQANYLDE